VAPDQTEVEWLYHSAVAHVANGEVLLAEKTLAAAIARAPEDSRAAIESAGGREFYEYGADAVAVRLLQRALARQYDSGVALTTAWILATSGDDAVRDGIAALMLAEPLGHTAPSDPAVWSAIAAAQAELGRFSAAIAAAERALAAVRPGGDPTTLALLQQRLEVFRSGRPWRR
jgi:tetratricopeptide (TPR) repeat protein